MTTTASISGTRSRYRPFMYNGTSFDEWDIIMTAKICGMISDPFCERTPLHAADTSDTACFTIQKYLDPCMSLKYQDISDPLIMLEAIRSRLSFERPSRSPIFSSVGKERSSFLSSVIFLLNPKSPTWRGADGLGTAGVTGGGGRIAEDPADLRGTVCDDCVPGVVRVVESEVLRRESASEGGKED
eukprot:gene18268-24721_t